MHNVLYVGDPHVKPSNIEESHKAMDYVLKKALEHDVKRIVILGDSFHTHAVVRLEVLDFWTHWFKKFSEAKETIVLVGNHDMLGDRHSDSNALNVFKKMQDGMLTIVSKPTKIGLYGYLPYINESDLFLHQANWLADNGCKTLICHQTINGCQYENGFYAPDGVDPDRIPFSLVISGHIHKRQTLNANGKTIIYPGTWKWDTASDANEPKGFWLATHDEATAQLNSSSYIDTSSVCTPIVSIQWKQGEDLPAIPTGNVRLHVELIGTSDWVKEQKARFIGKASIKSRITDIKYASRKSVGDMANFIENVFQTSMDKKKLLEFMRGEGLV